VAVSRGEVTQWNRIEKRVALALAVVAAMVLFMAGTAYHEGAASLQASSWVAHTYSVLENLEGVLADLTQLRISLDPFINSGNESDLAPYRASREQLRHRLDSVRQTTSDNPRQQERAVRLEKPRPGG
jgi:methyl-accepting chemotaxis protein